MGRQGSKINVTMFGLWSNYVAKWVFIFFFHMASYNADCSYYHIMSSGCNQEESFKSWVTVVNMYVLI